MTSNASRALMCSSSRGIRFPRAGSEGAACEHVVWRPAEGRGGRQSVPDLLRRPSAQDDMAWGKFQRPRRQSPLCMANPLPACPHADLCKAQCLQGQDPGPPGNPRPGQATRHHALKPETQDRVLLGASAGACSQRGTGTLSRTLQPAELPTWPGPEASRRARRADTPLLLASRAYSLCTTNPAPVGPRSGKARLCAGDKAVSLEPSVFMSCLGLTKLGANTGADESLGSSTRPAGNRSPQSCGCRPGATRLGEARRGHHPPHDSPAEKWAGQSLGEPQGKEAASGRPNPARSGQGWTRMNRDEQGRTGMDRDGPQSSELAWQHA